MINEDIKQYRDDTDLKNKVDDKSVSVIEQGDVLGDKITIADIDMFRDGEMKLHRTGKSNADAVFRLGDKLFKLPLIEII